MEILLTLLAAIIACLFGGLATYGILTDFSPYTIGGLVSGTILFGLITIKG